MDCMCMKYLWKNLFTKCPFIFFGVQNQVNVEPITNKKFFHYKNNLLYCQHHSDEAHLRCLGVQTRSFVRHTKTWELRDTLRITYFLFSQFTNENKWDSKGVHLVQDYVFEKHQAAVQFLKLWTITWQPYNFCHSRSIIYYVIFFKMTQVFKEQNCHMTQESQYWAYTLRTP